MVEQFSGLDESDAHGVPYAAAPILDVEKYREYVDDFDLSEEQKIELLQTLWSIVCSFVNIGFGLDAVQCAIPALKEFALEKDPNDLERNENAHAFNDAAQEEAEKEDRS